MSTSDSSCKEGASKLCDDDVCEVNDMLQKINTADEDKDIVVSICANCGKEGSDNMNTCNKCKQVKYCNAACKKKHRSKHKKQCERRVAELHDEKLFKQPPPKEDCPICFLRLPTLLTGSRYYSCCGKVLCSGCAHAPVYDNEGNIVAEMICPFCRTPHHTSEEENVERLKLRMDAGDPEAIYGLGVFYREGVSGIIQDHNKALELFHRSAELGYSKAYIMIGISYDIGVKVGHGIEIDKEKALHYYELAAMRGDETARHNLGIDEEKVGNWERALKHFVIASKGGDSISLNKIKQMYTKGHASKEDYSKALQSYQTYLGEIKSRQRGDAAAFTDEYRYY